jgi:hypothetical protein
VSARALSKRSPQFIENGAGRDERPGGLSLP